MFFRPILFCTRQRTHMNKRNKNLELHCSCVWRSVVLSLAKCLRLSFLLTVCVVLVICQESHIDPDHNTLKNNAVHVPSVSRCFGKSMPSYWLEETYAPPIGDLKITSTSTERQKRSQNLAPVLVIISGNSLAFSRKLITSTGFYRCCAHGTSAPVVVKNQSPNQFVSRYASHLCHDALDKLAEVSGSGVVRSAKLQKESSPKFSNLRPESCTEFCPEVWPPLRGLFVLCFLGN